MITNSQFLATVYGPLEFGKCGWYVAFRGDPNKVGPDAWGGSFWIGTQNQALMIDKRTEDNLYYSVGRLAMQDGLPRRSKQFFDGLAVLLADDADPTNLNGDPSFIVETSPGKKQLGVLLDQDDPNTRDLALIDAVMQAMADAKLIAADKSGNNAVRLARLPNATNGKGGANHKVQLLTWHPERRYTLEDALGIFGIDLEAVRSQAKRQAPTAVRETASDAENAELIRRIQSGESYHDPLIKLSAKLVAAGAQGGAVVNLLRGLMEANGDKSERWKSRYDEIPRMVSGAARFRPEQPPAVTINLAGSKDEPGRAAGELAPMDWGTLAGVSPEPATFRWAGWLPARTTTLLSANGGVGKSNLSLQLAAGLALGGRFLGEELEACRVLVISAEDEARTVHFRLANICQDLGAPLSALTGRLVAYDLTQSDCVMWRQGAPTARMQWLADVVNQHQAEVVVIDNASDVFNANENDRAEVRGFMRSLNAIAHHSGAAILLLAHVDKASVRMGAGVDTQSTFSGSTAWNNSARSRWAMTRDLEHVIALRHEKCNLGPLQSEVRLEFDPIAKVFRKQGQVVGSPLQVLRNSHRVAVLKLIEGASRAGQPLSMAATANNNAYRVLSGSTVFPKTLSRKDFFAMLFDMQREGLIEEREYENGRKVFKTIALTAQLDGNLPSN